MFHLYKDCYSVKEAAKILGISPITLYRLIESRKIEHRRINRRILLDRTTLETFGIVGCSDEK